MQHSAVTDEVGVSDAWWLRRGAEVVRKAHWLKDVAMTQTPPEAGNSSDQTQRDFAAHVATLVRCAHTMPRRLLPVGQARPGPHGGGGHRSGSQVVVRCAVDGMLRCTEAMPFDLATMRMQLALVTSVVDAPGLRELVTRCCAHLEACCADGTKAQLWYPALGLLHECLELDAAQGMDDATVTLVRDVLSRRVVYLINTHVAPLTHCSDGASPPGDDVSHAEVCHVYLHALRHSRIATLPLCPQLIECVRCATLTRVPVQDQVGPVVSNTHQGDSTTDSFTTTRARVGLGTNRRTYENSVLFHNLLCLVRRAP